MRPSEIVLRSPGRVRGLDSLRFFAALWVVFAHVSWLPVMATLDRAEPFERALRGLWGNLFCGVAGVMVFFVISGFCIHYPQVIGKSFKLLPFYTLRFLRVGIPLGAAVMICWIIGYNIRGFSNAILWSLYAELIYYAIYPLVLVAIRTIGWKWLMTIAWVGAGFVILLNPSAGDYHVNTVRLTWLLGFPCWLMGCRLAEQVAKEMSLPESEQPKAYNVWPLRGIAWGTSGGASFLRFHTPLGYPWTLNFFAIFASFWIHQEIRRYSVIPPKRIFEWAGSWSYSIYLMHMPISAVLLKLIGPDPEFYAVAGYALLPLVLLGSYLFFLMVEKPGHVVARSASKAMDRLGG
jgi:peptidoglycan/LPS O-acetylase OafA/YrhL